MSKLAISRNEVSGTLVRRRVRLDMGGGAWKQEGFTSVGIDEVVPMDVEWNFWNLPLPFEDDSVETVYSSELLEHFPRTHALDLLKEFYRILEPRGRLNIYVPNMTMFGILLLIARILNLKYMPAPGLPWGTETSWETEKKRQGSYYFNLHKHGYVSSSLKAVLEEAGFGGVSVTTETGRRKADELEYEKYKLGWFVSQIAKPDLHGVGVKN